ncbi:MAG: hypothetical protein M0R03_09725 [Novosphingobium sp.]|nr:hypothetical protein [Novosphingobium sp.]
MKAERARLARLQRLERIRAIAKQAAAGEAARAESTLAQLEALAARTARLAGDYAGPGSAADGWALRQWGDFSGGLYRVHAATLDDAERARAFADEKQGALARAERSRAAVEERADRQAERVARGKETPALGGRRRSGTELD